MNGADYRADGRSTLARPPNGLGVLHLEARLRKITTTDEGKVSLAIELEATDADTLEQIRDLIRIQQQRAVLSIHGVQGELPL